MGNNDVKNVITSEGLKKYEEELQELKSHRMREISEKIKAAREQGDLSENADYDAAREEQTEVAKRIEQLENILSNATVIDDESFSTNKVNIGSEVILEDPDDKDEVLKYRIVGSLEADSLEGKISNESPVGKALIGHKVGQSVSVITPNGTKIKYKIIEIR